MYYENELCLKLITLKQLTNIGKWDTWTVFSLYLDKISTENFNIKFLALKWLLNYINTNSSRYIRASGSNLLSLLSVGYNWFKPAGDYPTRPNQLFPNCSYTARPQIQRDCHKKTRNLSKNMYREPWHSI